MRAQPVQVGAAAAYGRAAATGDGGPKLSFDASLPKAGDWRLYVQFQTAGVLHTAAITLTVK